MRKLNRVLIVGASLILSGCFSREDPFYEDSQIVQAPRFQGEYDNEGFQSGPGGGSKDGSSWVITPSLDNPGKYELWIKESNVTVTVLATIFRAGTNLFLDLYPLKDSGVYTPGDAPTITQALRGALYKPLHVVWRIELSDKGINYWSSSGAGDRIALSKAPELKRDAAKDKDRLFIPGTPKDAQKYLLRFKDDPMVFDYKGRLVRKKDAQPGAAADGSQPFRSETNRTSGAAGSRR